MSLVVFSLVEIIGIGEGEVGSIEVKPVLITATCAKLLKSAILLARSANSSFLGNQSIKLDIL
jgi:hypothetical protein